MGSWRSRIPDSRSSPDTYSPDSANGFDAGLEFGIVNQRADLGALRVHRLNRGRENFVFPLRMHAINFALSVSDV